MFAVTLLLSLTSAVQPESPRFVHEDSVHAVAFAPDGNTIASAGIDRSIRLWKTATGELIREVGRHEGRILALTFSPDGKLLVSASSDLKVHIWDPSAGKRVRTLDGHKDTIQAVAFRPDGALLATSSLDQTIRLWDPATGKIIRVIEYVEDSAPSLAFSPDGKELYVGFNPSPHLRGYDVTTGKEINSGTVHRNGDLTCVVAAGRFIVAGTASGILKRFDRVGTLDPVRSGPPGASNCLSLAASADGKLLLVGGAEGGIDLIETATMKLVRSFNCGTVGYHVLDQKKDAESRVRTVGFSANGAFLVAGNQAGSLRVWRLFDLIPPRPFTSSSLAASEIEAAWAALADPDAKPAYQALARLGAYPDQALPFLAGQLKPAPAVDERQVQAWIARLDDDDFDVREKAYLELRAVRNRAEKPLRDALAGKKLAPEGTRRVEELLQLLSSASPEGDHLREQRLILLLQVLGSLEARKMLETLAAGDGASATTADARAALTRLGSR